MTQRNIKNSLRKNLIDTFPVVGVLMIRLFMVLELNLLCGCLVVILQTSLRMDGSGMMILLRMGIVVVCSRTRYRFDSKNNLYGEKTFVFSLFLVFSQQKTILLPVILFCKYLLL